MTKYNGNVSVPYILGTLAMKMTAFSINLTCLQADKPSPLNSTNPIPYPAVPSSIQNNYYVLLMCLQYQI